MFRVIGGAVVYGFALYGVVKFFDRRKMAVVIQSGTTSEDMMVSESSSHDAGQSTDQTDEASSRASTPADAVL